MTRDKRSGLPLDSKRKSEKIRTTVRLPRTLYDEVHRLVKQDAVFPGTFNDLFTSAVRAYLKMLKRKQIDAAFGGMANDSEYQNEARAIAEEFAASDWEALETAETK